MLSPLRNRFGIPGVISVIALVFAMLGGAYAASNSSGDKATSSAKAKQGPRGKTGKTGPAGPAGSAGPQGPAGPAGPKGDTGAKGDTGNSGTNGTNGAPGAPGKSILTGSFDGSEETPPNAGPCDGRGGSEFEVEDSGSPVYACNGEEGTPWTAGGTLPPGATETGGWGFSGTAAGEVTTAISFSISLSQGIGPAETHFVTAAEQEAHSNTTCPGSLAVPTAPPGHLCVYEGTLSEASAPVIETLSFAGGGASRTGAAMSFTVTAAGAYGAGSFAVTGCSAALPPGNPNKCP